MISLHWHVEIERQGKREESKTNDDNVIFLNSRDCRWTGSMAVHESLWTVLLYSHVFDPSSHLKMNE